MTSSALCNAVAALDLDPIKVKLMHVQSGEGWSLARANAVELEYRRFLQLMKQFPEEETAPLVDVDTFWHYHILDTMKYAVDCDAVFGYFLHHFPYIGLRGEDDEAAHERVGQRMRELYEATFGEPYGIGAAGNDGAATAFSGRVSDTTAYSGRISNDTAYSGRVSATAYSGRISATAYSGRISAAGATAQLTAYSGRVADATAFSGRIADATAYSGRVMQAPTATSLYAARPCLPA
ncbi:glycine-rich domain-containing protein [Pseudoduganella buxea]|uniref:Glycine-rich domain-containing protein-like n=1 Tax=Pseudoduganella buxea TaxID=1949069 RepID=A0A6I3SRT7_9BURK|nr:hypothetical protein [Pseudoduganella buxea]MTV51804.1 hypothetical protein [Pseudoduganella buxea]GGC12439.1 hypothetical protein GCM10011572_37350 [Pseudoduganella buxea]